MRLFFLLLLFSFFGLHPCDAERLVRSVEVDGQVRECIVHIPDLADRVEPLPVLFAFHPALADGEFMERTTQFNTNDGGTRYIVVYPTGRWRTWNAGDCCSLDNRRNVDDVMFFRQMLADVSGLAPIEPRAFVTGYSNGAVFVYHLMCHAPDLVRAAAPFGSTPNQLRERPWH